MKYALITGGSSGIGFEMSRRFAGGGFHLLWAALGADELLMAVEKIKAEFPNLTVQTLAMDLSIPASAVKVRDWAYSITPELDILINNAGFATYGLSHQTDMNRDLSMISLNVVTLYEMNRLFLDKMISAGKGTIINISSNTSFQPVVRMNAYASTKAFVTHFSRGLQEELAMLNIPVRVMTVCPAAIKDTAFKSVAGIEQVKTFNGLAATTSAEVADDVWKAYHTGRNYVVTGWKMRLLHRIRFLVPYALQQYLVRKETESK